MYVYTYVSRSHDRRQQCCCWADKCWNRGPFCQLLRKEIPKRMFAIEKQSHNLLNHRTNGKKYVSQQDRVIMVVRFHGRHRLTTFVAVVVCCFFYLFVCFVVLFVSLVVCFFVLFCSLFLVVVCCCCCCCCCCFYCRKVLKRIKNRKINKWIKVESWHFPPQEPLSRQNLRLCRRN